MKQIISKLNLLISVTIISSITFASFSSVKAEELETESKFLFNKQHQAGIRLGVWSNRGEIPPLTDSSENSSFKSKIKEENVAFEAFYGYRLFPSLVLEGSLGLVNRGSVTFIEDNIENVGNLLIYTFLAQAKLYPLGSFDFKLQPYLMGGGGVYYGRRSVQFTTNYYYYDYYGEKTATDFNYCFGGGIDYPISNIIGLELSVKYLSIDFSDPLLSIRNYDAFVILIGVKYLFQSK